MGYIKVKGKEYWIKTEKERLRAAAKHALDGKKQESRAADFAERRERALKTISETVGLKNAGEYTIDDVKNFVTRNYHVKELSSVEKFCSSNALKKYAGDAVAALTDDCVCDKYCAGIYELPLLEPSDTRGKPDVALLVLESYRSNGLTNAWIGYNNDGYADLSAAMRVFTEKPKEPEDDEGPCAGISIDDPELRAAFDACKEDDDDESEREGEEKAIASLSATVGLKAKGEYSADECIEYLHKNYSLEVLSVADLISRTGEAELSDRFPLSVITDGTITDDHCAAIYLLSDENSGKECVVILEERDGKISDWWSDDYDFDCGLTAAFGYFVNEER